MSEEVVGEIRSLDPELQKGNIYLSGILASSVTLVPSLQRELLDSEAHIIPEHFSKFCEDQLNHVAAGLVKFLQKNESKQESFTLSKQCKRQQCVKSGVKTCAGTR